MFAWCAGAGLGGWLTMLAFWVAFVSLALWTISRLIPAAPHATHTDHSDHSGRSIHGRQSDIMPSGDPATEESSTTSANAVDPRPR